MPMPPWSWIDCWPTNLADLPICTLAAATAVARSPALSKSLAMVANIDMLRACSVATNMSAARCCRVWKLPIGTPNCFRVFRYSTVVFSDSSIMPTASAHIAVRASSTPRSISIALIERVVDEARTAMCAEAVGMMDESLKTTVEYLKTRKQFGVPIGSFQTLQHRAADMFVATEQARSMSMFATMANDFDDAKERATAVAAAKVQIGKSAKFVGQQSIQLHGGIGMTQEAKIGHYFKRLTMIENTFGDTDYHLRRVTNSGGLV